MDSAAVPQALIKAFYQYWWRTPLRSPERSKVCGAGAGSVVAWMCGVHSLGYEPAVPARAAARLAAALLIPGVERR